MLNDTRCVITLVGDSLISGMYRDGEIHITFNGCEGAGVSLSMVITNDCSVKRVSCDKDFYYKSIVVARFLYSWLVYLALSYIE